MNAFSPARVLTCLVLFLLIACRRENGGNDLPGNPFVKVQFGSASMDIAGVDSVAADFFGANGSYKRILLARQGSEYSASLRGSGVSAGEAYLIIYRRPSGPGVVLAQTSLRLFDGTASVVQAAPLATGTDNSWELMQQVYNNDRSFHALIGVSPSNPAVYLYTNTAVRDYIFINKTYWNGTANQGHADYQHTFTTPFAHPLLIRDAFATLPALMTGRTWTELDGLAIAMQSSTGAEDLRYFTYHP